MKAPVAASMRQGNHGPQARSICKKISPQHAQTGKHEYFLKAEIHGRSKPWEFFTDDKIGSFRVSRCCAKPFVVALWSCNAGLRIVPKLRSHGRPAPINPLPRWPRV